MKLEQLEQFIKVIDFGSISKAAMKMHMAQSTLSTSLKKFEEELSAYRERFKGSKPYTQRCRGL